MATPDQRDQMPSLMALATSGGVPQRSFYTALVVGTLLTAVNQGDLILAGEATNLIKILFNYLIPYCVATWGAVTAKRAALKRGDKI
ncbi:MAG: nitrate/nitrite transporter NrtS [Pseudomonadota bacterium]